MKPNVLIILSLITVLMCVPLVKTEASYCCGCTLSIYSTRASAYVTVRNNTVVAKSDYEHNFFKIMISKSIQFYLYDMDSDRFICTSKKSRKKHLEAKKKPDKFNCVFQEKTFDESPYVQYVNVYNKHEFGFDKSGSQPKIRHKHNMHLAFLPKQECGCDKSQCWKKMEFCCRMSKRKRLPKDLTTFCRNSCSCLAHNCYSKKGKKFM